MHNPSLTNDKDIAVNEDGAMLVGGLALIHSCVTELHVFQYEDSSLYCTPGVWVYIYTKTAELEHNFLSLKPQI